MRNRWVVGLMMAILAMAMGRALADDQPDANAPTDPDGSIALSEYLATFAHQILREDKMPAKALDLSAALYQAAMRLNPNEPRFSRALADICLEQNDTAGSIAALKAYLNLQPADQTAMVQQIDVYLRTPQMQSLVQRLHYLRSLLQMQQIPSAVRSEVALRCARFYMQRAQLDLALKMLDTARTLDPVNLEALRTHYIMTQADALPVDRVQQLLGIMQANPADPTVASRLAEQLAQMGLVDAAITWYGLANTLYARSSAHPDPAFVLGATSELLLGNHPDEAAQLAGKYVEALPDDADGWFVWLSVVKCQLDLDPTDETAKAQYAATIRKATNAVANRLQSIRHRAGDTTATTRPIDSPGPVQLPNLSGDQDLFKSAANTQLYGPYVESLTSLAWLNLYYAKDTAAADPLIAQLAAMLPANNIKLRSLQAWRQMVGGDTAGALPKLRALAGDDPLAAMGVLIAESSDPAKKDHIAYEVAKLINQHPSGIIGAVLWAEFNRYHVAITPSPSAAAIATLVANVPSSFMELITQPKNFYQVQITPVKAAYKYGDPILVRVSLQNISDVDLAIGDECAVQPELWIDAHLRGTRTDNILGAAIGRLNQRLALAPNDVVSTVLRVDQDALFPYFNNNPNLDLLVNLTLIMNPTHSQQKTGGQPTIASPGLCGYSVQSSELIAREPVPIGTQDQQNQFLASIDPAEGGEKIRLMQVLFIYVARLHDSNSPQAPVLAKTLLSKLRRAQSNGSPIVLSWQKYLLATLSPTADDRFNAINIMSQDSVWETRLLSLESARELLGAKGLAIANQLSTDADPIVRRYAVALAQSLQQAPATQPSETTQTPESTPGSAPAIAAPSDSQSDSQSNSQSAAPPQPAPESSFGNARE